MKTKLPSCEKLKNLENKVVLLRVDYNVPLYKGVIGDKERILRSFKTLDFLIKKGAKVVLLTHRGRPDGVNSKYSLKPVFYYLKKYYKKIKFSNEIIGEGVRNKIQRMKSGDVLLLENLRFNKQEEMNGLSFARGLARLGDYYINDAFSVSHRAHTSVHRIVEFLPSYAGLNLIDEVEHIDIAIKGFKRPSVAVMGGVKISTKIKVIKKFAEKFDRVLIGGALVHNFLLNSGYSIGASVYEEKYLALSREFLKKYSKKIVLPLDVVISRSLEKSVDTREIPIQSMGLYPKYYIVDIGSKTLALYLKYIKSAKTVVWNGPMGMFEVDKFANGTYGIAKNFAKSVKGKSYGLAGGGETVEAINNLKLSKNIDFVSTGGGAMLEYIENGSLPCLEKLKKFYAIRTTE